MNDDVTSEADFTFTYDKEPALMLAEKMPNLLVLNEEKATVNPFIDGEDQVETNMWYLDKGATDHMTKDRAQCKELHEKFIRNMKVYNGSILPIQDKGFILYHLSSLKNNIINLDQVIKYY